MEKVINFEPKFITFDCYGTLTDFSNMTRLTREIFGDRLQGEDLERFISLFSGYRYDEVLGPYKPYVLPENIYSNRNGCPEKYLQCILNLNAITANTYSFRYREILINAVRRTCARTGVKFSEEEAEKFYLAVPTW